MVLVTESTEFCRHLEVIPGTALLKRTDQTSISTLPGQARVSLQSGELEGYLRKAHLALELDKAAPKLWLVGT
jgi:hypothetical protein